MRCLFFGCLLLLCSCSGASLTNKEIENAKNTLTALEESLPSECISDTTKLALRELDAHLEHIESSCNLEIKALEEKNSKKDAFIALLGIILVAVSFLRLK